MCTYTILYIIRYVSMGFYQYMQNVRTLQKMAVRRAKILHHCIAKA